VLSINAAISAVVVLASRLHYVLTVFALMLFSVEAFALFPIFRRRIQVSLIPTRVMPCVYSNMERSRCQFLFNPLLRYF
jgi:phosphatidylinositol glycan class C protein